MKDLRHDPPLDLIEMRRQITALRSLHSENLKVTCLLTSLLIKIAYLTEPEDADHEQRLLKAFNKAMAEVQKTLRASSPSK